MNPNAANEAQARHAQEQGWLDTARVQALLNLAGRFRVSLAQAGRQASWLTSEQADALERGSAGGTVDAPPPQDSLAQRSPAYRPPTSGDRLGDYLLGSRLGQGAMGTVFRARHVSMPGVERAVKVAYVGTSEASRERFAREARSLSKVTHPGVVNVHGADQFPNGTAYYVMDLIEGEDLSQALEAGGLQTRDQLTLCAGIARALEAVHAAGIIHRDLKPANVMVRADTGAPLLTDFGLARDASEYTITQSNAFLGTPTYMAPEQALGSQDVGPHSDGGTCWYLVDVGPSGLVALTGPDHAEVLRIDSE